MNLKQQAALEASKFVKNKMIVGLGTGSTAKFLVDELGRKVKEDGLEIIGVTTSTTTAKQAKALNIPLKSIDDVPYVDLTIDGSDEIDPNFYGIKGGGGALLYEKTVATYSNDYIWIVDETKMVDELGNFPLPVEVIPYGHKQIFNYFEEQNYNPTFRRDENGELFITDSQNYIIDLHLNRIDKPHQLANKLSNLTGVVEHGLFLDLVKTVIIGTNNGPKILKNPMNL